jgi:hypothetical protein
MKCLATPAPNFARTHSSKFLNDPVLVDRLRLDQADQAFEHRLLGSEERWFWNGYRTYLSSNLIQLSRSIQRIPSLPRTLARNSLKCL